MLTKENRTIRVQALTRLSVATREKMEPSAFVVYIEDTARFSTEVVVRACRRLESEAEWFPKVAELVTACQQTARYLSELQEQKQRARQLMPPPMAAEKWAEIQAQFKAVLRKRTMPK